MPEPTTTAVCHVRAPLLLEPVDRQVETLQACESEGAIDDLLLRSWPKEIALTDTSPYQEALESFERFEAWADEQGVSIRPPFKKRTMTSQLSGETRELLVMPLVCLEVYADDELVGVFPHTDEELEETYTTDEVIASLRTGELPTPLNSAREADSATTADDTPGNDCPDCGASLVDGQGLFTCASCGWFGTVTEAGTYVPRSTQTSERPSTTSTIETH